jgi:thiamine transport system permease protein
MPIVIRMTQAALAGLGREPREASANAGAGAWQTFRLVEAPMIRGTLVAAFGFALLASIGEFGSASLLAYGDQATLPLVLLRLISRPGEQNYSMAMAASALLVLLVFVLIGASELVRSRRQRS